MAIFDINEEAGKKVVEDLTKKYSDVKVKFYSVNITKEDVVNKAVEEVAVCHITKPIIL